MPTSVKTAADFCFSSTYAIAETVQLRETDKYLLRPPSLHPAPLEFFSPKLRGRKKTIKPRKKETKRFRVLRFPGRRDYNKTCIMPRGEYEYTVYSIKDFYPRGRLRSLSAAFGSLDLNYYARADNRSRGNGVKIISSPPFFCSNSVL